jgi:hypothetical protein
MSGSGAFRPDPTSDPGRNKSARSMPCERQFSRSPPQSGPPQTVATPIGTAKASSRVDRSVAGNSSASASRGTMKSRRRQEASSATANAPTEANDDASRTFGANDSDASSTSTAWPRNQAGPSADRCRATAAVHGLCLESRHSAYGCQKTLDYLGAQNPGLGRLSQSLS